MFDILLVLQCLNTCMDSTSLKRLKIIVPALLAIFLNTSDTFVLAGDETVVTKSGKKTFGLDRFFSW